MLFAGLRRGRQSEQCFQWLTSTSMVFPIAAFVVTLLTFVSTSPTPGIIGLLAIALVPWALLAGGVTVRPLAVVLVTAAPTAVLIVSYDDQAALFLGVLACTWTAAQGLRVPARLSFVLFSAIAVACSMRRHDGAGGWVIWSTGMMFGWFAGTLLHRQQTLTAELAKARHELDIAAIEQERKSIAREVHDIVGHSLTVVLLNIAGARRNLANNPAAAADALERAERVSRDSLETVRSVVTLLSSADESQRDAPLPAGGDVVPLLEQATRSGMPVDCRIDGDPNDLEPSIGLTLVRLLQESLANASRHAPGERVDVVVDVCERSALVTVANALPATVRSANDRVGTGVAGMRDRVAAVGGSIDIGPCDGRWVMRACLPRAVQRTADQVARADGVMR